jgi:Zn-dependent peptidase ImmA (M78 family)
MHVPFWHKSKIEEMALDLLRKYYATRGVKPTPPIDVDDIIEGFLGIDLQFVDLKTMLGIPDVLGATWFDEKVMRIDTTLEDKEGRLGFTMAHEVGHWWMHRPLFELEKVSLPMFAYDAGKPPAPALICRSQKKKEGAEYQADQFAAMLLMPASLLRSSVSSIQDIGPIPIENLEQSRNVAENRNLRSVAKTIKEGHGFTNVSIDALCYRLVDLNYVMDANPKQPQLFS